jgi:glyceraldehyde 3-phosphate dehydrogenase/D-erythrose 4-phosphate dehydrogenase
LRVKKFSMTTRAAINGYGRIGRCLLRAAHERGLAGRLDVVAINELANLETMAYLTRYDSTHGRFPGQVEAHPGALVIDGREIAVSSVEALDGLDWGRHGVDLVFGAPAPSLARARAKHLRRGARRVCSRSPRDADVDATIVYGINHGLLRGDEARVSAASCTTNCIVPVIDTLARELGLECGVITTIHSAMNDQPVLDAYHHTDLRKTRALQSMIRSTPLAAGIGRVLPNWPGALRRRRCACPR